RRLAGGDAEGEVFVRRLGRIESPVVHPQEDARRDSGHTLVAVNKSVVLRQVKQISRRLCWHIAVKIGAAELRPRLRQRRLKQTMSADAVPAAVALDVFVLALNDLAGGEQERLHHSASRLSLPP